MYVIFFFNILIFLLMHMINLSQFLYSEISVCVWLFVVVC